MHRIAAVILLCLLTHVVVSLLSKPDSKKGKLVWTDLGGHRPTSLRDLAIAVLASILLLVVLGRVMVAGWLTPTVCGVLGGIWVLAVFVGVILLGFQKRREEAARDASALGLFLSDDRLWAGLLARCLSS